MAYRTSHRVPVVWAADTDSFVIQIRDDVIAVEIALIVVGTAFTFKVSRDPATTINPVPLYVADGATLYSLAVGATRMLDLPPHAFKRINEIQVISNGTETSATTVWLHTDRTV